jgi:hypothetical protein
MPFLVGIEYLSHRNNSNVVYTRTCTYIITRRLVPFGSSSAVKLSLLVLRPQVRLLYQLPTTIEGGALVKVNCLWAHNKGIWWSGVIAPLILNLGFTPRSLYPWGINRNMI